MFDERECIKIYNLVGSNGMLGDISISNIGHIRDNKEYIEIYKME